MTTRTPSRSSSQPTRWHALDPLTRLVVAVATVLAVIISGGVIVPTVLLVFAVLLPATLACSLREVVRTAMLLAAPLALSVVVVNVLFTPEGNAVLELGPLVVTEEGIRLAIEVLMRVLVMTGAVVLFYVTTRPGELMASLQWHGVPSRLTFVIHNAVSMIPRLAQRASEVSAAQRARGLDTEGHIGRRARGLMAMTAPTVLGAIHEAETRALALETRGFSRPGRPTVLYPPRDTRSQRFARWAMGLGVVVLAIAQLAGVSLP